MLGGYRVTGNPQSDWSLVNKEIDAWSGAALKHLGIEAASLKAMPYAEDNPGLPTVKDSALKKVGWDSIDAQQWRDLINDYLSQPGSSGFSNQL